MTGPRAHETGTANLAAADRWGWQEQAACKGESLDLFFGREGERQPERAQREKKAKAICRGCPVRSVCADYAIDRPEKAGTWGALNEDERASARRSRLRRQQPAARSAITELGMKAKPLRRQGWPIKRIAAELDADAGRVILALGRAAA